MEPSIFTVCCNQERADQLRAEAKEHRQEATTSALESVATGVAAAGSALRGDPVGTTVGGSVSVHEGVKALKEGFEAGRKEREADQIERGEDPNKPYTPPILREETWQKNYVERDNIAPDRPWTYNDRGGRDYDGIMYNDGVPVR